MAKPRYEQKEVQAPMMDGRVPPNDLDAEMAVLCAVMLDDSAFDKIGEMLKAEYFYSEAHRRIFEACRELKSSGRPVDVVQVATELRNRERLAQVGGMQYLSELINATPAIANVQAYAQTIHEKWRIRQLIVACQRVSAEGYMDYGEPQLFIDQAEQAVYNIARTETRSQVEPLKAVLVQSFKKLTEAAQRGDSVTGISTGFERYDKLTAGLHDGDLSIIAARPGMGKTSLVLNMAVNVAAPRRRVSESTGEHWEEPGIGCCVFSLEMPREQLANRMVCSEARVDVSKLRAAQLTRTDWQKLTKSAEYLSRLPVWVDDSPGLSLLDLRSKVRRIQAEYDKRDADGRKTQRVGCVIIDYLQLMRGRENAASREQEISEISRGLKGLAKELSVSVIALSQLNRAVETRGDKSKRPMISDLRESGAIEQDADNIVFIYRDDYYNKDSDQQNVAELILAKQRNGPTGTAKVRFDREYTRFDNLAEGEYPDDEEGN